MYSRSELRNACFRAKNGVSTEKHAPMLDLVLPLLKDGQRWDNFSTVWDLIVTSGKIVIVKPEVDYDYVHSTLLEASLYKKQGIDFDSFNDRQISIIAQVESIMLDGVMTWETYNKTWGVSIDPELKKFSTKLYNVSSNQIEVTEEMIVASQKDADGSAFTQKEENVLQTKVMTTEQSKAFEEFLAKKYKGK